MSVMRICDIGSVSLAVRFASACSPAIIFSCRPIPRRSLISCSITRRSGLPRRSARSRKCTEDAHRCKRLLGGFLLCRDSASRFRINVVTVSRMPWKSWTQMSAVRSGSPAVAVFIALNPVVAVFAAILLLGETLSPTLPVDCSSLLRESCW
jgi:hypothetical protein